MYWSYVTNEEIKRLSGNTEEVSGGIIIFGWFCAIPLWYYWYKWDKALQYISGVRGSQNPQAVPYSSNFALWLIFHFIGGIGIYISMYQVQDYINNVNGLSS
jgi:hypothetical protein